MKKILVLLICFAASQGLNAFAGDGGTSTGGGGETVNINGRPSLRDLTDHTTCIWEEGDQFLKRVPYFKTISEKLKGVHWYFGFSLEREANSLLFCPSRGALKRVPTEDQDGVTIVEMQTKQVAIRINERVYVDMSIFNEMSPIDQGYLVAHESMHSFILQDAFQRNTKLRSTVNAIRRNVQQPFSRKQFGLQLKMNSVEIVNTTEGLDAIRDDIEFALSTEPENETKFLAADRVFGTGKTTLLRNEDQKRITAGAKKIGEALWNAAHQGDLVRLHSLIQRGATVDYEFINSVLVTQKAGGDELVAEILTAPTAPINTERCIEGGYLAPNFSRTFDPPYRCNITLLMRLVGANLPYPKSVKTLLNRPDLDVNVQDALGFPALSYAVAHGDIETVKAVLSRADVDVLLRPPYSSEPQSAWHLAAKSYYDAMYKYQSLPQASLPKQREEARQEAMKYFEMCRLIGSYRRTSK